ncbi:MAG: LAGLIDADG family homing endonuclease, partial [Candidatus Hodarchaeales archaeon]
MTVTDLIVSDKNIPLNRHFVPNNNSGKVFDLINWEKRTAQIKNIKGEIVFEQKNVEIPKFWSQTATNIVVSKYFSGTLNTPQRETSVRQLIGGVADTITKWGVKDNYFENDEDAEIFKDELTHIIVHQYATFNSPVWFNVRIEEQPQCSACQPYHSLINTVNGLIPIGEIVEKNLIGLPVFDAEGITEVVNVKHNGKKPVYRIKLVDGHFIEATGDHLVCAHDKRRIKKFEWKRVDELEINNYMRIYSEHTETISTASKKEVISEAALAGWLQADGFVGQYEKNGKNTNTSLTAEFMTVNDDEQDWVMNHLNQALPNLHYHERAVESKSTTGLIIANRIRMYGEVLRKFVDEYELLNRGTDIRVPKSIMTAPNDVVAAYLKSVYESDGYVANNGRSTHLALATISKEWMEDILVLLSRFGIYARLREKLDKRPNKNNLWEVDISIYSERKKFRERIGFISARKKSLVDESLKEKGKQCPPVRYQKIVEIKQIGITDVYDIQTKSSNYLSNNVLVHNCFINSIEDNMESILELTKTEGMLFKWGSGTGTNLSPLRSSYEGLSRGGIASGPVSFMKGYDSFAGVIKSGGKCYKEGTLVSLPDGLKPIEKLKVGDLVLTHNGVKPILDFMSNGKKQCYLVKTKEGYEVEVTQGHKFAFWSPKSGNFIVKPIEEFNPGDQLYVLIKPSMGGNEVKLNLPEIEYQKHETTTVEMKLPKTLNDELSYILGLSYGDGNVTPSLWRLRWSFSIDEMGRDSTKQFLKFCKNIFEDEPFLQEGDGNWVTYTFTRKRLFRFLKFNNLLKGKADNLDFPNQLFTAPMNVRAAFIAGMFDADGNYQKRGGFSIKIIDKAFLKQLQLLLLSLGIPSKIRLARAAKGNWKPLFSLNVVGSTFTERFAEIIGDYSIKVRYQFIPSIKANKGWGYRDVKFKDIQKWGERGTRTLVERSLGYNNNSVGYGGVLTIANKYPDKAVGLVTSRLSQCVPVTLIDVVKTTISETYDIEVSDEHLLVANGIYASNTRRAAKMVMLNIEHPDVMDFVRSKANEEKKAWALIDAGYDGSIDGEAYGSVYFQNANHSVRVTDEFMEAVLDNKSWKTRKVTNGEVVNEYNAQDILKEISEATYLCGDPGLQYDTTINDWHTSSNTDRIHASNPCSEYMYLNDSACNLASINLLKYLDQNGHFDVDSYIQTIRIMILAQEILVGNASYPTKQIEINSHDYRPLGLGYANLG